MTGWQKVVILAKHFTKAQDRKEVRTNKKQQQGRKADCWADLASDAQAHGRFSLRKVPDLNNRISGRNETASEEPASFNKHVDLRADVAQKFTESLILAQDERWRRA